VQTSLKPHNGQDKNEQGGKKMKIEQKGHLVLAGKIWSEKHWKM
jgi:hypothetical protein